VIYRLFNYDVPIAEVIQYLMRWTITMIDAYEQMRIRKERGGGPI
jgi:hypothetical protein